MNFKYKCFLQTFFSNIPKGEKANYLFQKYFTKSLPPSYDQFLGKVTTAFNHYNNFKEHNQLSIKNNRYYEFGAGWNLIIPLAMSFLDFEVYCIDIKRLIIKELIDDSLYKFNFNRNNLPFHLNRPIILDKNNLASLKSRYMLRYYAPKDARATQFDENYFDFISSSLTLEHIPKNDILLILRECYRILSKGGILSITIDYQDHWSYFDKSISIYNYLKYTSEEWKKYNPSLHYQNRMRHSDYLDLISQTDFNIVKEIPRLPSEAEKETLKALNISEEFKKYEIDDLAIRGCEIVLRK